MSIIDSAFHMRWFRVLNETRIVKYVVWDLVLGEGPMLVGLKQKKNSVFPTKCSVSVTLLTFVLLFYSCLINFRTLTPLEQHTLIRSWLYSMAGLEPPQ